MNIRCGLFLTVFLAGSLAWGDTSSFTVAYFNLAGEADGERPASFAASIDASPGYAARLAEKTGAASWRDIPPGFGPENWLSLVKVKFGQQCDFLAFRFAGRDGTLAYAGRRPSRVQVVKYYYSVPPGPDQIPENAIREAATDFVFRQSNETARVRPPLQIILEPWAEAETAGSEPGGASVRNDVLEAMAFAAAYEAGWQPTTAKAASSIRLSAQVEMGLFIATRAVFDTGAPAWLRRNIPREALYNHLARLFFRLRQPAVVFESAAFGSREAVARAWREGKLILSDGEATLSVQPSSGRAVPVSSNEAALPPGGRLRVERDRIVTAADPATGKTAWSYEAGDSLLGFPVEREGRVVVAARNNVIAVLDAATGAVLATRTWPTWLLGFQAVPAKGGLLVACTDLRRRLTLLRAADLKTVSEIEFPWPLKGPVFYGEQVPAAWALSAADEAETLVSEFETTSGPSRPGILCQDRDGFLHAVSLPAE